MNRRDLADAPLLALLRETAFVIEDLVAAQRQRASRDAGSMQRAALAIELRLQLEEQVLLPALRDLQLHAMAHIERQVAALRDLLHEARHTDRVLTNHRLLWAGIARVATLHFDAVDRLVSVALQAAAFDQHTALAEAEALRRQWRIELAETGDIEDEEADPVGQAPR